MKKMISVLNRNRLFLFRKFREVRLLFQSSKKAKELGGRRSIYKAKGKFIIKIIFWMIISFFWSN